MQELDLSYNSLTSMYSDIFTDLPSLKLLNVSHNQIINLPQHADIKMQNQLSIINLSHNSILVFPSWFLLHPNIMLINMDYNDISFETFVGDLHETLQMYLGLKTYFMSHLFTIIVDHK